MTDDNITLRQQLGRGVRTARVRRGMTGGELAQRMRSLGFNWNQSRVSRIETAALPISVEALIGLAIALDRPVWRLLDESGGHAPEPTVKVGDGIMLAPTELASLLSMSPRNVYRVGEDGEQTVNLAMTQDNEE